MNIRKLKKILLTAGAEESEYRNVEKEITLSNRKVLVVFSVLITLILGVLFVVSFFSEGLSPNRILYGGYLFPTIIIHFLANKPAKDKPKMILILTYLFLAEILSLGIVLGTVLTPEEITAAYIALLLTAPQMFTDRPYRLIAMIVLTNIVFIAMALIVKDPITWSSDITNASVFGLISIALCIYSDSNRVSRYCLEGTIRFLAESDQLTGMLNRHSYEQSINEITDLAGQSVFCVYVDINGLHELNNAQGHEAGDRMLQYVGNAMQNIFGRAHSFRIGGDEYVVLDIDREEAELRDMIARLKAAIESAGYHAAIGYSFAGREALPVREIIKEAEKNMNSDKRAFYMQAEHDRRRAR